MVAAVGLVVASAMLFAVHRALRPSPGQVQDGAVVVSERGDEQPRSARVSAGVVDVTVRPDPLYRPPIDESRVSVAGVHEPLQVSDLSVDEVEKMRAAGRIPAPEAVAVGEAEKEARRAEKQRRRELREQGIDPGRKVTSGVSPGNLVVEEDRRIRDENEQDSP